MKIPNKNTLQTLVASFALFSCNLYSQDFKDAKDNLLRKNQISLEKLKDTRKRIQNEKIPLASSLSALERKVSEKRRALDRLIRLRDNKSVGLNSLKKKWKEGKPNYNLLVLFLMIISPTSKPVYTHQRLIKIKISYMLSTAMEGKRSS